MRQGELALGSCCASSVEERGGVFWLISKPRQRSTIAAEISPAPIGALAIYVYRNPLAGNACGEAHTALQYAVVRNTGLTRDPRHCKTPQPGRLDRPQWRDTSLLRLISHRAAGISFNQFWARPAKRTMTLREYRRSPIPVCSCAFLP